MAINWGLAQGNGFQNALATGMQMGAQAREAKERREYRNALANYDPANPETIKPIMEIDPRTGMALRKESQAMQAQQMEADLTQRALAGDPDALLQMATVNFDKWKTLDSQQRDAITQEAEVNGNAAMDVLRLPPQQRAQAVMAYANRLGSQEIAQLADLPPQELEAALRAAIAEAGMVKELHAMERPDYQAVPYDSTLVNVRDPQAVAQFAGGGQAAGQPPSKTLSNGVTAYQNPETGEWFDNPQEAMGGAASNGSGGF